MNVVINRVFDGLITEALAAGGDVLKFGGDAIVVGFAGPRHEVRAVSSTARMQRFIAGAGRVETPLGPVRLRMSGGLASGTQPYHLVGTSRVELMVAGPVSSAMARLEGSADAGELLVDERVAAAVPARWVGRRRRDGARRVRILTVDEAEPDGPVAADPPERAAPPNHSPDLDRFVPDLLRPFLGGRRAIGQLKYVAMSFLMLGGVDEVLAEDGPDAVHEQLAAISAIVDATCADLGVCWLETDVGADAAKWILTAGAPTASEHDPDLMLRAVRRIADDTPADLRIGVNAGGVFVGDIGHERRRTFNVMGDAMNLAARLMARAAPGEILVSASALAAATTPFHSVELPPFPVKGKRAMIVAHELGPSTSGPPPPRPRASVRGPTWR